MTAPQYNSRASSLRVATLTALAVSGGILAMSNNIFTQALGIFLIGAMFADKGQVNDVEWKLYKMEQRNLPFRKGLFSKSLGEDSVKIMDDFFKETFLQNEVAGARIPFACPETWPCVLLFRCV